jgi:hypothetical protein
MSTPRSILRVVLLLCALSALVPAVAGAYAKVAPPPSSSTGSGLPDGRVYELVSPFNKHGYEAGANASSEVAPVDVSFSIASPDGNAVAFKSVGPAADTDSSGLNENFVSERTSHGWVSRSTTARGLGQNETLSLFVQKASWTDYSPDLSHLSYVVHSADVAGAPVKGDANFYLLGSDPLEEPTWLFRSLAGPSLENLNAENELIGMSPDASVVYFTWGGPLLAQDASRSGSGIYESRGGTVSEAGVLPDGSVPASGALPVAGTTSSKESYRTGENNPASLDNQLSENGMRLFFVSGGELYVHTIEADGSERSELVSASLLPGHVGEAAVDGVVQFENRTQKAVFAAHGGGKTKSGPTYAYASPDGSHIFFQSADQLTAQAPVAGLKAYDFDVDTGTLEYLPGVALGGIVTAAEDGSSFVFVNDTSSPEELDLWSASSNGGKVRQIAQLPGGGYVGPGRTTSDDSVLVFQAQAPIAGFNDVGGEQVYRYDIDANELACVSCPPAGVLPSGDAYLSAVDQYGDAFNHNVPENRFVNDARGVSSDGTRIFFASPDPLVSRDTNGTYDTYEWENGTVFLISSGSGSEYSPFLDNSESGGDVFFATADELVQGDNDGGFDVYDARVPRPGDNPPPAAVPCSGDVCQGPPSVAQLLGAPPSATFNGAGNIVEGRPAVKAKSAPKRLTKAQKLIAALSECRKQKIKRKRPACEKRARERYRAIGAGVKRDGKRGK